MVVADALSRVYTEADPKKVRNKRRSVQQMEGKSRKHVEEIDGVVYWKFDSGRRAIIPRENDREVLVMKEHQKLGHRSITSVHYSLKQEHYWPGMKNDIAEILKRCTQCQIYNRKRTGGYDFIETSRYLKK
ncbi:MAG: integrase zinc binding domain-containing protein [Clostridium sp.]|uniref:integrase zinc binding domain-containing protein n=1 Tax=Clostridium sp. TaxID=1506 RepID=UPI003F3C7C1F